ncbi:hypothetical protein [Spongiivirga citrea]|uniref:Uncharacterized protein n=1 Tax=Spongiivirga citrea TaxID=1481457 RepID=A0A6M0CE43_9FLAO|nr:hypothetical protein [Spongiivirga citrea]NER16108.1 hypothetical protein [Spongiivirga citrea]
MSSTKQFVVILSAISIACSITLLPLVDITGVDEICLIDLIDGESESHECSNESDFNEVVDAISHNNISFSFNDHEFNGDNGIELPHSILLAIFSPPPEINS